MEVRTLSQEQVSDLAERLSISRRICNCQSVTSFPTGIVSSRHAMVRIKSHRTDTRDIEEEKGSMSLMICCYHAILTCDYRLYHTYYNYYRQNVLSTKMTPDLELRLSDSPLLCSIDLHIMACHCLEVLAENFARTVQQEISCLLG